MKRTILILGLIVFAATGFSQTAYDALRFSSVQFGGTSRFMAAGGAFGAVGADASTMATNPAGIGLYNSVEFTFTPSVMFGNTQSEYNTRTGDESFANFAMGNFGFVYPVYKARNGNQKGLLRLNVGFGMNRQNDFNNEIFIQGPNRSSSLLNGYIDELNGRTIYPNEVRYSYPFDIGLAYDCALIYYDSIAGKYTIDMPSGGVYQQKETYIWGSINEFDMTFAGNVANKLYFGLTLGIPTIRYYQDTYYTEYDSGDTIPYFRYFDYKYTFESHGTGVNVKGGVIYRPASWIRLGVAVHTPTWYLNMRDYYSSAMYAEYDSALDYPAQYSPNGHFDYELTTPFRAMGSVALFISKYGFISGEYEYVNYNQARLDASGDEFRTENDQIRDEFKSPVIIRVGTEWKIDKFRVRAGFGYYGEPDKSATYGPRYVVSGGAGFFMKHFFVDLGYQWTGSTVNHYLYSYEGMNPAELKYRRNIISATTGFRF